MRRMCPAPRRGVPRGVFATVFATVFAAGMVAPTNVAAAARERVDFNDPDAVDLHVSASVYYALIARHYFSWGAHGQATLVVAPALELQGSGMVNLPGSGVSLFRMEGSAYFAITSLHSAPVTMSSSTVGNMVHVEYVNVPDALRKKFGLELGGFLDRHGVSPYSQMDRNYDVAPIPITSLGLFAGLKWVRQLHVEMQNGARGSSRVAIYVHGMMAVKQSGDLPTGVEENFSKWGGRFGFDFAGNMGWMPFMKFETGMMPSFRGPDLNMFLFVGVKNGLVVF